MPRWSAIPLFACAAALCLPLPAHAKDFMFGGRSMSCQQAGAYRDTELFLEFASAVDNFDATREKRIQATIDGFRADLQKLTADMDKADALRNRRIAVAVAGIVLGETAEKFAVVGVKPGLSQVEKKALEAVAGRGAEWSSVFLKYGATGDIDVTGLAAMPVTLLLAFSPFGVAEKAWSLGNASIDIATAVAEAEITRGETELIAATTIARAEELARKMQMPRISELNRLKNEIDKQCG